MWIRNLTLAAALCTAAFAESNPAAGSWKLIPEQSHLTGPLPYFVHDGLLKFPPEIYQGKPASRAHKPGGPFRIIVTPNGRTLTVTSPTAEPDLKMVFERQ